MRRKKQLRHESFSIAILLIFILFFADFGAYKLWFSNAASATANLWVNTTAGASPSRCSPACVYNAANSYGTFDSALAASSPGDTILVKCGTYSTQSITTVKSSGNVTFSSETPKCATIEANGAVAVSFGNGVGYLTLDNLTVNGRITSSTTTGIGNNNITISNSDIDVGKKVNGQPVSYSVGSNLTITGNTIGPSCCGYNGGSGNSPEGIRIGKPNSATASCTTQACDVTITNNLIQYTVRDCQYWPSSGFGSCPDTTCTNGVGCHMDGIHIWGVDGANISGNRLYGVECQGIFLENTNNSLQRDVTIKNNAISSVVGGCGNKGIYLSAGGATDGSTNGFAGTWDVAFNSGGSTIIGPNGCGSCQPGTKFNLTGNNMILFATNNTGNGAGCTTPWGTSTINYTYNVWRPGGTNQACGSHDLLANASPAFINEVNPPATGIDLHLAVGSQAIDYVPSSICSPIVTADFENDSRPQGPACDASADEVVSSSNPPPTPPPPTPPPPPPTKQGDCNNDNQVDVTDLSILLTKFNQNYPSCDFNIDSIVNVFDLSTLLTDFGT